MRLEGRGINLQAGTECICLLLFGYLIFHLTYSGEYLNYVTPRMKPYLYGLSVLMVIWAAAEGEAGPLFCFNPAGADALRTSAGSRRKQHG